MAKTFDPYRALGLRREATEAEVKAAHRRLAKRFHPDASGGSTERFLDIQEAYRVLSDPLLRREWDARHAPGPIRADRPVPGREPRASRRGDAARPTESRAAGADGPSAQRRRAGDGGTEGRAPNGDPARKPRSSRAYTWSASEVPWWEEGAGDGRRRARQPRRPGHPAAGPARTHSHEPTSAPEADAHAEPVPNAFDVYNRSSGAAWSMAARAYFRRGDQELPRRGTFHYEGTQVLTGARARAAAAAAAASPQAGGSTPAPGAVPSPATVVRPSTNAGVSRDARQIQRAREAFRRRLNATAWPSLRERLGYALLAWIPFAVLIGYGGSAVTGCDVASIGCPPNLETMQAVAIALTLGLLVGLPRVAYVGAIAAFGALVFGLVVVGAVALIGVQQPLPAPAAVLVGGSLLLGYATTVVLVLVRNPGTRPWAPATGTGDR